MIRTPLTGLALAAVAVAGIASGIVSATGGDAQAVDPVDEGCPVTSTPAKHAGETLRTFADAHGSGVTYDEADAGLELTKSAGLFRSTAFPVDDVFNVAAAADYDKDGWTDIVVAQSGDRFVRFYKNRTYESREPNWDDPDDVRKPKFVRTRDIEPARSVAGDAGMVAGDFNQDGNPDFFYYKNEGSDHSDLDYARIYLGRGDGRFYSPYEPTDDRGDFGYFTWTSTNSFVSDMNGDGWPDIVFGTKLGTRDDDGAVLVFINDCPDVATQPPTACSEKPRFRRTELLTDLDLGAHGANALSYGDYTGDGINDLVVGSPSCCSTSSKRLRLYPGLPGGGFSDEYDTIESRGAVTVLLPADYSLDGKLDLITGSDDHNYGSNLGGEAYYYRNDGDNEPFSGGATQRLTRNGDPVSDFDVGVVFDYDNDPDDTPDLLIADGNHSGTFFVFSNRVVSNYVECGTVASGVLDLGELADEEMVVNAARLTPAMSLPAGTSATFFMSNEEPANWQVAPPCPDDSRDRCVSFPRPVGREVRWKAVLCSNEARNRTPTLSGVEISFDYTVAEEHYRAGVVIHDGVAYAGGFVQPGDRGRLYATSAALSTTYWEAGAVLDDMRDSDRNLFTATKNGKSLLRFESSEAWRESLQDTLAVARSWQAERVIDWARSARFGIEPKSRLGAVETSTPAVVGAPVRPVWYEHADADTRRLLDEFIVEHQDRPTLVLFGSKDGFLHAIQTVPTDLSDPRNGREAWGFVPAKVAARMASDVAAGTPRAYPDGSPAVADVRLGDGKIHTVLVMGEGNGGQGVFALDITETIDEETGEVRGPEPLWHRVPGGSRSGQASSKPVIARVNIGGNERFIAIIATGISPDDPTPPFRNGRDVEAIDIGTGDRLWRFRSACAVTSDLVIFETDDELEPGAPEIDGFIDRAVWSDACGNVYKLDPGVDLGGGWHSAGDLGVVDTGEEHHGDIEALFSTTKTACAIGEERPIVGTLGARPDATGRMVLFFGTGGIESYDPSKQNAFYAVYADTGEIRGCSSGAVEQGRIVGECVAGVCEKWYGGVVVTAEQVLVTRAVDPPVGSGSCDYGSASLDGFSLDTLDTEFTVTTSSASVSSLYGDAGAVYFATLAGDLVRVGTPRAPEAGGGSSGGGSTGGGGEGGGEDEGPTRSALRVGQWRQLR